MLSLELSKKVFSHYTDINKKVQQDSKNDKNSSNKSLDEEIKNNNHIKFMKSNTEPIHSE